MVGISGPMSFPGAGMFRGGWYVCWWVMSMEWVCPGVGICRVGWICAEWGRYVQGVGTHIHLDTTHSPQVGGMHPTAIVFGRNFAK